MGTGPRLGAGRTLPPAGPKLLQGEKTEWGKWDGTTTLLLTLSSGEETVASQVGCIVGSTLVGVPNTCGSSLGVRSCSG